jgi:hypothetical protein
MAAPLGLPGSSGNTGAVRSSARSGTSRPPTAPAPPRAGSATAIEVADLVDDLRIGRQLPGWTRCGVRPKARQIREMAVWLSPLARAMTGSTRGGIGRVCSQVLVITCSTWAWVIDPGTPGRGSSLRPSGRRAAYLVRPWPRWPGGPSVGRQLPLSTGLGAGRHDPAAPGQPWLLVGRCAQRSRVWRSSSVNVVWTVGRPRRCLDCGSWLIARADHFHSESLTQDTGISGSKGGAWLEPSAAVLPKSHV